MTHRYGYVCMSCNRRWRWVCRVCIEALPEHIPEKQIARWMYAFRQKIEEEK